METENQLSRKNDLCLIANKLFGNRGDYFRDRKLNINSILNHIAKDIGCLSGKGSYFVNNSN